MLLSNPNHNLNDSNRVSIDVVNAIIFPLLILFSVSIGVRITNRVPNIGNIKRGNNVDIVC